MLAGDAELDVRTDLAAALCGDLHQFADAGDVQKLERVLYLRMKSLKLDPSMPSAYIQ